MVNQSFVPRFSPRAYPGPTPPHSIVTASERGTSPPGAFWINVCGTPLLSLSRHRSTVYPLWVIISELVASAHHVTAKVWLRTFRLRAVMRDKL